MSDFSFSDAEDLKYVRIFDPQTRRGLSFSFSSDRFLKYEIPLALAANKKIRRNSSIEALLRYVGQLIAFILF